MKTKETHLRNSEQSVHCEYKGGTFAILILTDKRMKSSKISPPQWDYHDLDAKVNIHTSIY